MITEIAYDNGNVLYNNSEFFIGMIENIVVTDTESEKTIAYPWTETINVHKKDVLFKIDTGVAIDVLPLWMVKKLWPEIELQETSIILRVFGGQKLKPTGMCTLFCNFSGCLNRIHFAVVDLDITPILGLHSCIKFKFVQPSRSLKGKIRQF